MRKVCKKCKRFVEGPTCPICKGNQFTDTWKGRIFVIDAENSEVAKKMNLNEKGEYAIKIR